MCMITNGSNKSVAKRFTSFSTLPSQIELEPIPLKES